MFRTRYFLAAPIAVVARIPFARNFPRLETLPGVPNLFQLTLTFSLAASARWALVGPILPARLSKSLRAAD
jgi:hypothetical protein